MRDSRDAVHYLQYPEFGTSAMRTCACMCVCVCVRVCVRAVAVQASARSQANSLRDGARKFNGGAQSCLASEVRAASDVVYYKIIKHYALVYTFIHCAAYVRLRGCVTS